MAEIRLFHLPIRLLFFSGISAIAGMLLQQYFIAKPPLSITTIFSYFSITFGCILLFVTLKPNRHRHTRHHVRYIDILMIIFTCLAGGIVTSWISVGAGELIALLLFLLGYPTMVSVCIAVCISSMVVLSGIPYHLFIAKSISLEILLFAAPAALIGGVVARVLAEQLGPIRLKVFFAVWIIVTGFAMS